jgi:hypothetical protein
MTATPFAPEQFAKASEASGVAQSETDLKKWLRSIDVAERVDFIQRLWPINYILALNLVRSSQLPIIEVEALLRHWLALGQHNAAQRLIGSLEPLLGERKFWKIVAEVPLSEPMRDFLNYHRIKRGRIVRRDRRYIQRVQVPRKELSVRLSSTGKRRLSNRLS